MLLEIQDLQKKYELNNTQVNLLKWLIKQCAASDLPSDTLTILKKGLGNHATYKEAYEKLFYQERKAVELAFHEHIANKEYPAKIHTIKRKLFFFK